MASKPLQRSINELKKQGYQVGITERFNSFVKIRQDFCGFADAIAFHPDQNETLAIQACADNGGSVSAHLNKLLGLPAVKKWVSQPSRRLEIWGFGKRGERGKRKLWTLRKVEITKKMFDDLPAPVIEHVEIGGVGIATVTQTENRSSV